MKLIVSNLKMNLTLDEVKLYIEKLNEIECKKNQLIVCPSYPYLSYFNGKNYILGSQNVASEKMGAFTGEVSIEQLVSLGIRYVIIGHSERRIYLKEDHDLIRKKLSLCFNYDVVPIFCVGERLDEKTQRIQVLKEQIDSVLNGLELKNMVIAYEPVWSIGTGLTPIEKEIQDILHFLKEYMKDNYSIECKVLYGGSVNLKNIQSLNQLEEIDGYLIGGASLKIEELKKIVEILEV